MLCADSPQLLHQGRDAELDLTLQRRALCRFEPVSPLKTTQNCQFRAGRTLRRKKGGPPKRAAQFWPKASKVNGLRR
jgi:hypothetical protein